MLLFSTILMGWTLPWSPGALGQDLASLDRFISQAQEAWPVPGMAVVIVKDGQTVFEKGYGMTEVGGSDPVDEHTLFAIASNTKAFTSAALAMLVEEGKPSSPIR
jgi:CubicO group peptidase (beta-lactamase class C family)